MMARSAFGPGLEADLLPNPSDVSESFDGFCEDFGNGASICRLTNNPKISATDNVKNNSLVIAN
jgi:hypothetical protein